MENLREILEELGYTVQDYGKEYRCRPIYRDSNNNMSLAVKKNNGRWTDFGISETGSFEALIQKTLGIETKEELKKVIHERNFYITPNSEKPKLHGAQKVDENIYKTLESNHEYWVKRGITETTIKDFSSGISKEGKLKNRYVFPIFDTQNKLVGLSGRALYPEMKIKWKHLGDKTQWTFPLHLNENLIKENKKVVLVESIGDALSLYQHGIKEVLVCFGTGLSIALFNTLIKYDPNKILISLNNEPDNANIGNDGCEKILNKLSRFFDKKQLQITLPFKKDFNEMNEQELQQWKEKYYDAN